MLTYFLQHNITALAMACQDGSDEIATLLIEHGADVNLFGNSTVSGSSVHKYLFYCTCMSFIEWCTTVGNGSSKWSYYNCKTSTFQKG